jgi:hypothetical protein
LEKFGSGPDLQTDGRGKEKLASPASALAPGKENEINTAVTLNGFLTREIAVF